MIGDRLRMVAGRHGDHAALPLVGRKRGELDARAALLERVGDLQILVFDENLRAGERGQLRRRQHRRGQHVAGDDPPRRLDVGKRDRSCDGHRSPRVIAPLPSSGRPVKSFHQSEHTRGDIVVKIGKQKSYQFHRHVQFRHDRRARLRPVQGPDRVGFADRTFLAAGDRPAPDHRAGPRAGRLPGGDLRARTGAERAGRAHDLRRRSRGDAGRGRRRHPRLRFGDPRQRGERRPLSRQGARTRQQAAISRPRRMARRAGVSRAKAALSRATAIRCTRTPIRAPRGCSRWRRSNGVVRRAYRSGERRRSRDQRDHRQEPRAQRIRRDPRRAARCRLSRSPASRACRSWRAPRASSRIWSRSRCARSDSCCRRRRDNAITYDGATPAASCRERTDMARRARAASASSN